ncbi:MAG: glycosyltransferase involved in cell wall biosynthesis [Patiriisocius sp.]|jgi:glycosyltransferase involved in cell wall biosynthesis
MILITHHNNRVVQIENQSIPVAGINDNGVLAAIFQLAKEYPNDLIVWVEKQYRSSLNLEYFRKNDIPDNNLLSFNPGLNYMSKDIGYVEDTLFINVNKNVKYATWLMSAIVGCARSSVFNSMISPLPLTQPFVYYLNTVAKSAMAQGLLCYSSPGLLLPLTEIQAISNCISTKGLFQFVRQSYKKRWLFLLAFQQLLFDKRFTFHYILLALVTKKRDLKYNPIDKGFKFNNKDSIDVVIPTMGRSSYLYNVLVDLKHQNLIPERVIIVEQNPEPNSVSQLAYLNDELWPFKIDHTFIHQTGACNARNIALTKIKSTWVFFADDDIRIPENVLENAMAVVHSNRFSAITLSCLQKNEKERVEHIIQWLGFGSNTSLVLSEKIKNLKFNMGFEFGYGEDGDFGMQLRNNGTDILYVPSIQLLHLKAPVGGFRQKHNFLWDVEDPKPKPSPTVMLYKIKHFTATQLNSYRFMLFVKVYKSQKVKNPISYLKKMNKSYATSKKWALKLMEQND